MTYKRSPTSIEIVRIFLTDDDDVYLDKLQVRVKKSIHYMWNVDYSQ
jgi:hypothetical protein